jgi:hypothetical protein
MPGSATGNVATKTLLRAFIIHLPKCRCLFLSMAPKPYLDGAQLGMQSGRVGSVDYRAKADQVGMAGLWPLRDHDYRRVWKHSTSGQVQGQSSAISISPVVQRMGSVIARAQGPVARRIGRKRPPVRLWQTSGVEKGWVGGHIRRMGQNISVVVGAGLIAMAIMVTNHWAIIPGGQNSIAATIRLNRWTGSIDVCSLDAKSVSGSNASGLQLTCEVQKTP